MGIGPHLRTIQEGFRLLGTYSELKGKPVVIGESDPEGCAACQGPALSYRNGTMYSSYTAASFARIHDLAELHEVNLEGVLTWAFEFEGQPYFAGFRSLASNGIDKPVLNVFRMFSQMTGQRARVTSDAAVSLEVMTQRGVRERPDVSALASLEGDTLRVMVWHYHDDDVPGADAAVQLTLTGLPWENHEATLLHLRIDEENSNAFSSWKRMGSPQQPTPDQYAELETAGGLAALGPEERIRVNQGSATVILDLPRQAVSLLVFTAR
jgi:xylan 1,4-beta-xylosidase